MKNKGGALHRLCFSESAFLKLCFIPCYKEMIYMVRMGGAKRRPSLPI
jgi:hypothetical protein